ncbi:hypothetical protein IH779_01675 [Patescibacteria group bacterium]|nr:hypothetical protein [Patescibacteria group bacterium]
MAKFGFSNQGQALIGILIVLVTVVVIIGGLYYSFQAQTPKILKVIEESVKREVTTPSAEEKPPETEGKIIPEGISEKPEEKTHSIQVPVLVLKYFPTPDEIITIGGTIAEKRAGINLITNQLVSTLEEGSIYHGYKDPTATPSFDYSIVETKEFLEAVPLSSQFPERGDKFLMFSDPTIGVADICTNYIDNPNVEVREVWIWMYHIENTMLGDLFIPKTGPTESNMAMGTISQPYWNKDTYGDVSNSARVKDLPVCAKTYTVYEYNYTRGLAEALENHGHQLESVFAYADSSLFWSKFVGPTKNQPGLRRCGNAHNPPNAEFEYDRGNTTNFIETDCEDWKPDASGQTQIINCNTWRCTTPGYFVWWMQNMPGKNNNLTYQGKLLRNWWNFIGDFDQAVQKGRSLTY